MDSTASAILQQTEMLRGIRDELRTGRALASGGGAAGSSVSASPAGVAARAQAMSDRVMAGDFANFGWTNAFSPIYKTTALQDIAALAGLSRSPSIMTQPEYAALASENLGLRAGNLVGGLLAPEHMSRTAALSNEIFANSPRWSRFGNSTSPLGVGVSRSAAMGMARSIQTTALGDMRLSPTDYSTIATVGMQTGQFDSASSSSDFMSKLKELAAAVGDVTRTLRMSAEEATKTMGSLRAVGITDIGQQRNTMMGVGAAAQVAGMTNAEMMGLGMGAAATGVQLGLSGSSSMLGVTRLAAQVREATASGTMDKYIVARGGGAAAIAGNIFNSEANFATSDAGYYSWMGRKGGRSGGYLDEMSGGLSGVAAGGYYGFLGANRNRALMTSQMTDEERSGGLRSYVQQQVGLMGVTDMTSTRAQDISYSVLQGMGMEQNAALAYSSANFSVGGQRAASNAQLGSYRAQQMMERKLSADAVYTNTSWMGRFNKTRGAVNQAWAGAGDWVAEKVSPGAAGYSFVHGQSTSGFAQQYEMAAAGLIPQRASAVSIAQMMANGGIDAGRSEDVYGGAGAGLGVAGEVIGGVGGVLLGLGRFVPGPVGWLMKGALVYAGANAVGALGSAVDSGGSTTTLSGDSARSYTELSRGLKNANRIAGRAALDNSKLTDLSSFKDMIRNRASRGKLSAEDSIKTADDVRKIAAQSGLSVDVVASAIVASGSDMTLADSSGGGGHVTTKSIIESMNTTIFQGADTPGVNYAVSENAELLGKFLRLGSRGTSMSGVDVGEFAKARGDLVSRGETTKSLDKYAANFQGMSKAKQGDTLRVVSDLQTEGTAQLFTDLMQGVESFASLILGESSNTADKAAQSQLKTIMDSGDRKKLFAEISSDSSSLGASLRRSKKGQVFRDVHAIDQAKDIGSSSAHELSIKYGVDEQYAAEVKTGLRTGTIAGIDQAKYTLKVGRLDQGTGGGQGAEQDRDMKISTLLNEASQTLAGITKVIADISPKAK